MSGCSGSISSIGVGGAGAGGPVVSTGGSGAGDPTGTGGSGSGGSGGGDVPVAPVGAVCTGADSTLRRLTNSELNSTFSDLASETMPLADAVSESTKLNEFFFNDRDFQTLNNTRVSDYEQQVITPMVNGLIQRESNTAQAQRKVIKCDAAQAACVRQVLTDFGRRAWRRPLTSAEIDGLQALDTATGGGMEGLGWALKAVFLSPEFLFVEESGSPDATLEPYALATRLSLFLWGTTPDAKLLDAAGSGSLANASGYATEVQRLLSDDKAANHWLSNVGGNWLGVNTSSAPSLTGSDFALYVAARPSMAPETKAFVKNLFAANAPVGDIVAADYSFVNKSLGDYYGVAGNGTGLVKQTLPSGRSGLLTQAHIIGRTGGNATPILRGSWVAKRLMCAQLTLPANFVIPPINETPGQMRTVKEIIAEHRANPRCAGCHNVIDPIGLALEELDEGANFRTVYKDGRPVESTTTLPGGEIITGPRGLGNALRDGQDFRKCASRQVNAFAYGVSPWFIAPDQVEATLTAAQAGKPTAGVKDLIEAVATSASFKTTCGNRFRK
jgi:Protein of unknown function (DUF1592)/Protein of unknown function (DUF1588)/Protein of unknown function (DUF1595)